MEKEDLHAGHRQRMIEKLLSNPDSFAEHELLEVLLFFAVPRVNTNGIAHDLIRTFGSIKGVFKATPEELMSVDGVGKKVAAELLAVGRIFYKVAARKEKEIKFGFSYEHNKQQIHDYFLGCVDEKLVIMLLSEKLYKTGELVYSGDSNHVVGDLKEIAKYLALQKPKFIIVAHNHPSGDVNPSHADDLATAQLCLICASHGIRFLDHVIVSGYEGYSYHLSGKLKTIKDISNLDKLLLKGLDDEYE